MSYFCKILFVALFAFALSAFADEDSDGPEMVMVSAEHGAVLRGKPGVHSENLGVVPNGTPITITGKMQGNWIPVKYDDQEGFIFKDLLADPNTGRTLDRTTEAGFICAPGSDCAKKKTVHRSNMDDVQAVRNKLKHKSVQRAEEEEPAPAPLPPEKPNIIKEVALAPFRLLGKLADIAWTTATKPRQVAAHVGYGVRSGNVTKGLCASGVKEDLMAAHLCRTRPEGDAVDMARTMRADCPGLHKVRSLNAYSAKPGSVIVYRTTRHQWGHIEMVVSVTAEFAQRHHLPSSEIGKKLYCSDFCSAHPTFSHGTNTPIAIFEIGKAS